ncbi:sigma C outer capsid fiber protein [Chatham orthoreovirus]|nr:sigma C outer capsid fiber protein [Chatham orthoreovirus]
MEGLNLVQRREVVSLVLSLMPSVGANPGDLKPIYDRLSSIESRVAGLNSSVSDLASAVSSVSSDLSDLIVAVGDTTAQLVSLTTIVKSNSSRLTDAESSITELMANLSQLSSLVTNISNDVSGLLSDVDNLKSTSSSHALSISDLVERVSKLEQGGGVDLTFKSPLQNDSGTVSLIMDPTFCSGEHQLESYSADAQFMNLEWLIRAGNDGHQTAVISQLNVHAHGSRSDFIVMNTNPITVTDTRVIVSFDLDFITKPPPDISRLVPSPGFQAASFPVDIVYTRGGSTYSVLAYGTFTTARRWEVPFVTNGSGTANITYLTLRYGIDT